MSLWKLANLQSHAWNEYVSYTNMILGKKFLLAIVWVIENDQAKEMY
jgi:hypothetical protein